MSVTVKKIYQFFLLKKLFWKENVYLFFVSPDVKYAKNQLYKVFFTQKEMEKWEF